MDCDDRKDLLMEFALGVLEGAERDEVLAHLRTGCPVCAGRLAEAHAILAAIPLSMNRAPAPVGARQRLLDRLNVAPAGQKVASLKISAADYKPRSPFRWMAPAIFGGAIAAGVTVLIFVNVLSEERKSVDNLRNQVAHKNDEIMELRTSAQEGRDMRRLVSSPAVQMATLHGSKAQPAARGQLIWDPLSKSFHFFAADLRNLAPGRAYELWLINSHDRKIPAGMCVLRPDGAIEVASSLKSDPGVIVATAVTDEPLAGVLQPTGSIQLIGKLD
jgi:anti-sigma-K factor RskA